jgi:uncharacterized phage-associated protein
MRKTVKFTISMSAAEFKSIESLRRKTGRTRSQFIRDAVAAWRHGPVRTLSVKEDQKEYGAPPASDFADLTDLTERRRRAIAAAGKFRSGAAALSSNHDRYLEEVFAEDLPTKKKG